MEKRKRERKPKLPQGALKIIKGRLGGKWIEKLDFTPGDVLMVSATSGVITYQYQENGIERTAELVRFARQNKLRLVQFRKQGHDYFIEIPSSCLKKSGIAPDEPTVVFYQPGILTLKKLEPDQTGL